MERHKLIKRRQLSAMVTISPLVTAVLLLFVMVPTSKAQLEPEKSVNVGQTGEVSQVANCLAASGFNDIPDLTQVLETKGRSVLVTFNVQASLNPNAGIGLRLVIDGQPPDNFDVQHFIGAFQGELTTLSWSRAYALVKGFHTFAVQATCQGGVNISRRWLTVYELR